MSPLDVDDVVMAGLASIGGIVSHRKLGDLAPFEDAKGTKWCKPNNRDYGHGGSTTIVTNADLSGSTKLEVSFVLKHNDGEEQDSSLILQLDRSEKLVGVENLQALGWLTDGFYFNDGTSDFNERNGNVARIIQDNSPDGVLVEIRGKTTGRKQKKHPAKDEWKLELWAGGDAAGIMKLADIVEAGFNAEWNDGRKVASREFRVVSSLEECDQQQEVRQKYSSDKINSINEQDDGKRVKILNLKSQILDDTVEGREMLSSFEEMAAMYLSDGESVIECGVSWIKKEGSTGVIGYILYSSRADAQKAARTDGLRRLVRNQELCYCMPKIWVTDVVSDQNRKQDAIAIRDTGKKVDRSQSQHGVVNSVPLINVFGGNSSVSDVDACENGLHALTLIYASKPAVVEKAFKPIRDVAKSGAHSGAQAAIKPFLDMYHQNRAHDRAERKQVSDKLESVEESLRSTQSSMALIMKHLGIVAESEMDGEEDAPDPYEDRWPDSELSSSSSSDDDEEMETAPASAVKRKKPEEQPVPVVLRAPKDPKKKRKAATPKATPDKAEIRTKGKGKGKATAEADDAAMTMLRSVVATMKGNEPALKGFRATFLKDSATDALLTKLLNEQH
jgi:hypothetical protein